MNDVTQDDVWLVLLILLVSIDIYASSIVKTIDSYFFMEIL